MLGNNLKTVEIILTTLNELIKIHENTWKRIDYTTLNRLFKNHQFTKIKIPFSLYEKELTKIQKDLVKLSKEYLEFETKQKESGILTNSEMDELIYKSYKDFVGDMHYMYGELSDREIKNRRQLIIESINLYKTNKNES